MDRDAAARQRPSVRSSVEDARARRDAGPPNGDARERGGADLAGEVHGKAEGGSTSRGGAVGSHEGRGQEEAAAKADEEQAAGAGLVAGGVGAGVERGTAGSRRGEDRYAGVPLGTGA